MKSRFIIVLLLGALTIVAGMIFKFLNIQAANHLLITGIFVEAIVGVLYALQISRTKAE